MDLREGFVEFLSALVIAAGTWAAAKWTGRSSVKAAKATAEVQQAAVEVDREDRLIQNLERRLARVDAEVERLRDKDTLNSRKIRHLEDQGRRLARSQEQDASLIEGLRQYVKTLRDYIEQFGHPVPPAPRNLHLDEA